MHDEAKSLSPDSIPTLIKDLREGKPVILVCQRHLDGFTSAGFYPVIQISRGSALCVTNDDGETVVLDDTFPDLDSFLAVHDFEDAEDITYGMQRDIAAELVYAASAYLEPNKFSVGTLVTWKQGMQICSLPLAGQAAIVVELLSTPVTDKDAHLLDPVRTVTADVVIGFTGPNGSFITTLADSRRFEEYPVQLKEGFPGPGLLNNHLNALEDQV
jgi:hypothetical protein